MDNQFDPNYHSVTDFHEFNASANSTRYFSAEDVSKFYRCPVCTALDRAAYVVGRGPFAHAATDFTGYHCQNAMCPTGDTPKSRGGESLRTASPSATAVSLSAPSERDPDA